MRDPTSGRTTIMNTTFKRRHPSMDFDRMNSPFSPGRLMRTLLYIFLIGLTCILGSAPSRGEPAGAPGSGSDGQEKAAAGTAAAAAADPAEQFLRTAEALSKEGRYPEAIAAANHALQLKPDGAPA